MQPLVFRPRRPLDEVGVCFSAPSYARAAPRLVRTVVHLVSCSFVCRGCRWRLQRPHRTSCGIFTMLMEMLAISGTSLSTCEASRKVSFFLSSGGASRAGSGGCCRCCPASARAGGSPWDSPVFYGTYSRACPWPFPGPSNNTSQSISNLPPRRVKLMISFVTLCCAQ